MATLLKLLRLCHTARAAVTVSALTVIVILVPDQIREIFVIQSQDLTTFLKQKLGSQESLAAHRLTQIAFTYLFGLLFLICLRRCILERLCASDQQTDKSRSVIANTIANFVVLAPAVAISAAFYLAAVPIAEDVHSANSVSTSILAYGGLLIFLFALTIWGVLGRCLKITPIFRLTSTKTISITVFLLAMTVGFLTAYPVELPRYLGTMAIIFIFLSFLVFFATLSNSAYDRRGYPVLLMLLIIAILFAAFGWNDNHQVRYTRSHLSDDKSLDVAYTEWLTQRKDRDYFTARRLPYPVYFISAEGGGLYAALHAASFLAKTQDKCPNFAQHVFGISSVSGGSLGAAVFAATSQMFAENSAWKPCSSTAQPGRFSEVVARYFSEDFLTPVIAAGLFPDFVQRFLPFPVERFDRGKALEASFSDAWTKASRLDGTAANDIFDQPIRATWKPEGATPALFLNTTSMATGSRITISPLNFDATPTAMSLQDIMGWADCETIEQIDITLSQAVSLSARFPIITPVAWLARPQLRKCRWNNAQQGGRLYLADGGYFENSGLETAWELVSRLRKITDQKTKELFPFGFEIRIITVFTRDKFADRWWFGNGDLLDYGAGEVLSPVMILMNTRQARARSVHSRLSFFDENYFRKDSGDKLKQFLVDGDVGKLRDTVAVNGMLNVILDGTKFFLPLGWHLSGTSIRRVQGEKLEEAATNIVADELHGNPAALKFR